jgi:hypothetical protein
MGRGQRQKKDVPIARLNLRDQGFAAMMATRCAAITAHNDTAGWNETR